MPWTIDPEWQQAKIRVRTPLYERFMERFPQQGSLVWFVNMAFEQFLDQLDQYPNNEEVMRAAFERYRSQQRAAPGADRGAA